MKIRLEKVQPSQKHILGNLLEFYVYEFSAYLNIDFNAEGRYGFEPLETYFIEKNYAPYFIKNEHQLVGFAIVKEGASNLGQDIPSYNIEEFFVAKKFMGQGVGKQAAKIVFDLYRGQWTVTQIEKNYPGQAFWRGVIQEYTRGNYKEFYDEKRRSVQQFDNTRLEH